MDLEEMRAEVKRLGEESSARPMDLSAGERYEDAKAELEVAEAAASGLNALSTEARRLIGAMLAESAELEALGIGNDEMPPSDAVFASQAVWDEVRAAFPLDSAQVCEGFLYVDAPSYREAKLAADTPLGGE